MIWAMMYQKVLLGVSKFSKIWHGHGTIRKMMQIPNTTLFCLTTHTWCPEWWKRYCVVCGQIVVACVNEKLLICTTHKSTTMEWHLSHVRMPQLCHPSAVLLILQHARDLTTIMVMMPRSVFYRRRICPSCKSKTHYYAKGLQLGLNLILKYFC